MFSKYILALPLLSVLVAAGPAFPPQPRGQYIDANYDDLTVVAAVPTANTLTTYRGLNYTGWIVDQAGVAGAGATIPPHTSPNDIVSGIINTSMTGKNAGWSVASSSSFFDQLGFYYACAVMSVEGAEGVPQQCTFNVLGYRGLKDADYVAMKQFSFTPKAGQVPTPLVHAVFDSSFRGLQKVEVVMLESESGEAGNAFVFDDNMYELYASKQY